MQKHKKAKKYSRPPKPSVMFEKLPLQVKEWTTACGTASAWTAGTCRSLWAWMPSPRPPSTCGSSWSQEAAFTLEVLGFFFIIIHPRASDVKVHFSVSGCPNKDYQRQTPTFQGCMRLVFINGQPVNLSHVQQGLLGNYNELKFDTCNIRDR